MTRVVGIPIKPFGIAKARLASVIDAGARSRVGKAIAARTAAAVAASGASPVIVTGDAGVAAWAREHGWATVPEPAAGGLDGAAQAFCAAAGSQPWAILHADLPVVGPADLAAAWRHDGPVIAPSRDGGTSLIAATGAFRFSYGPGSFHRHLARMGGAAVVVRLGLALDLDTPADLERALRLEAGRWLRELIDPSP